MLSTREAYPAFNWGGPGKFCELIIIITTIIIVIICSSSSSISSSSSSSTSSSSSSSREFREPGFYIICLRARTFASQDFDIVLRVCCGSFALNRRDLRSLPFSHVKRPTSFAEIRGDDESARKLCVKVSKSWLAKIPCRGHEAEITKEQPKEIK